VISYTDAFGVIESEAAKRHKFLVHEHVLLNDCIGRYAAEDVYALEANPRFDNSAMDGFLIVAAEVEKADKENPIRLDLVGSIAAGERYSGTFSHPITCIEIMTGAKIPEGKYNTIVRLEDVEKEYDSSNRLKAIFIKSSLKKGENIRFVGEDIKKGDQILLRGTQIEPQHLLALSMAGYSSLEVFVRPRVIVISTGDELVPVEETKLKQEQIRNSTAPLLCSVLNLYGANVVKQEIVRDDNKLLSTALFNALERQPDIIITTGGVSVGKYDIVESVLGEMSANIHFHKVAVRPGKPVLFSDFAEGGPVMFGLPGNPIAVAASVRFFVKPYLLKLMHSKPEGPQKLPITENVQKPAGLRVFHRGIKDGSGVRVLPGQASFMAKALIQADGWIIGDTKSSLLENGEIVEWYPLWK
jgi:molybdopterin molybdotransferase